MVPGAARVARSTRKLFKNVYAISMNINGVRYKRTRKSARAAGITIKYAPGVLVTDEMLKKGISGISNKTHDNVRGVLGCYLAQRNLLNKIAKDYSKGKDNTESTLILEDDVLFPKTFQNDLERVYPEVPDDWDVLFLGRTSIAGRKVSEHIVKMNPRHRSNSGNWAYLVKNKTLKKKILPRLKIMKDAIDYQFNHMSNKVNMYIIQPNIVNFNKATHSNIKHTNKIQAV
jgi:GR25 family glycosyltransferase involved in LPS biosynthesis